MEVKDIILNQAFTATFEVRDSASGDTVTYSILKASDGSSFGSGSATWVGNGIWKVAFTPDTDNETYLLVLNNTTQDVTRTGAYRATLKPQVTIVEVSGKSASDMLTAVNNAIMQILNGGGITQYQIAGRMVTSEKLLDLYDLRSKLQAEVDSARTANDQHTNFEFDGC